MRRLLGDHCLYDSPNWDVNEPLATKMEAQRPDAVPFDLMPAKYATTTMSSAFAVLLPSGRLENRRRPDVWQQEFQRRFGKAGGRRAAIERSSQVLP
jgi:hypothetical protein